MKNIITTFAVTVLAGSLAFAAGQKKDEHANKDGKEVHKIDTSKNPITGTETTTETYEKKVDGKHGKSAVEVKDKTKVHRDGKVSTETDIEADSSSK